MMLNEPELPADTLKIVRNPVDIHRYALELGLLDTMRNHSTLPTPTTGITTENHSTHWIAFLNFKGYAEPSENGWLMLCYPKSKFTFEEFNRHIQAQFDQGFTDYTPKR